MKIPSILLVSILLLGTASACGPEPAVSAAPVRTDTAAATHTPSATPPGLTATLTPTPTRTPTLEEDAWETMPVVPSVSETAKRVYGKGQRLGNDPHAFSILGDCLSLPINLFGRYGQPGKYNLGDYAYLQPVIDWFLDSFNRRSVTLGDGFNTAAVLSPLRADPERCEQNETPLLCEYRIHRPAYALISLGTDDWTVEPETYEERMRQIIEYTIGQGIIPILSTKADNREGDYAFNKIVARLAYEYDVPLWNFWLAVQPLAKHGVANDQGHLTWADPNHLEYTFSMQVAVPVRNVTALQTLTAVWKGTAEG